MILKERNIGSTKLLLMDSISVLENKIKQNISSLHDIIPKPLIWGRIVHNISTDNLSYSNYVLSLPVRFLVVLKKIKKKLILINYLTNRAPL